ncbi:MAG: metalloregulator ArsR/SmtB family transcription factor [Candidatus Aadella gelida]|nr:metalloregulator ArsR/SmtB family transcription factor [Candidatus Aadella gelida]
MDYQKISENLKAIAHPVRLRIVQGLMVNECNVGSIVKKLDLPQSTVSQHLSILRNKGIIIPRKEGVKTCYIVVDQKVRDIINILQI